MTRSPATLTTGNVKHAVPAFNAARLASTASSHVRTAMNSPLNVPRRQQATSALQKVIICGGGLFYHMKGLSMTHGTRVALPLLIALLIPACSPNPSQLESIAIQLSDAANRCVIDVRDKGLKYENSDHCRSLGRIAQQYTSAGGLKDGAPPNADRIAERARARAWMALAISKSGDPALTIW